MSTTDKDLPLKLRFKRIFWSMGYLCPLEVPISHYTFVGGKRKRMDITDVDVLGIRFDRELQASRIMADCKSGDVSHNRIFWLRGAMEYFGVHRSYFVKPTISEGTRAIADSFNISTLDSRSVDRLEDHLGVTSTPIPWVEPSLYEKQASLLVGVGSSSPNPPRDVASALHMSRYLFWYMPRERRILNLLSAFQRIAPFLSPSRLQDEYSVFQFAQLFSLALLEAAGSIYRRNLSDVSGEMRRYVFGGPMALQDRERFLQLLNQATGSEEKLEPEYYEDLLELVNSLIAHPVAAADVPRHIEALSLVATLGAVSDVESAMQSSYSGDSLKLAKDIVYFLVKLAKANPELVKKLASI